MTNHRNEIDLSNTSVTLLGQCFAEVLDRIDINAIRSDHTAGLMLADALQRAGFNVSRMRVLLSLDTERLWPDRLPNIDAHARALALWENADPDATVELPALHMTEAK